MYKDFTVFWSHPYYGEGSHGQPGETAEAAAEASSRTIAEHLSEDSDPLSVSSVADDLDIAVWEGVHASKPATPPAYEFA